MTRKIFRLTESDLRNMIRESISTVMDERFEITDEKPYDDFVAANNNKHLVIFDDDYKSLQDLIDGVKRHELLIHARRVEDGNLEDLRWGLDPQNGEEIRKYYSDSYDLMMRTERIMDMTMREDVRIVQLMYSLLMTYLGAKILEMA